MCNVKKKRIKSMQSDLRTLFIENRNLHSLPHLCRGVLVSATVGKVTFIACISCWLRIYSLKKFVNIFSYQIEDIFKFFFLNIFANYFTEYIQIFFLLNIFAKYFTEYIHLFFFEYIPEFFFVNIS